MIKKQVLYYGPPGTGKTYEARETAIMIVDPNSYEEINKMDSLTDNKEIDLKKVNLAFEKIFEYDKDNNETISKFLNDREYKPGKTCYRNMSALNKFMSILIQKKSIAISREDYPDKGPATFAQYTRSVTNFDFGYEDKIEGNKKNVKLNKLGIELKNEYQNLLLKNPEINLSSLRELPDFAKKAILESLENTDNTNMSMWKSTILGALWFICRNNYIFKYSNPKKVDRTQAEDDLLKTCFGYKAKDNEFLSWVIAYLEDLNLVVEYETDERRYVKKYYLSSRGKELLKNMKIISNNIEGNLDDYNTKSEKIYKLKDSFINRRKKFKEKFSIYRDCKENNIEMVTLHPSFEYENFLEGISVRTKGINIEYYNKNGILKEICYKTLKNLIKKNLDSKIEQNEITLENKEKVLSEINEWNSCYTYYRKFESEISWDLCDNFVLIIDEINRGDIAKVFGDTITLLETDKRLGEINEQVVRLPFTNDIFGIPKNLYIIATMNTSDKSISNMDIALRRRFSFEKCIPKLDLVNELYDFVPTQEDDNNLLDKSVKALKYINNELAKIDFIGSGKLIGHSYLMGKDVFKDSDIVEIWIKDIIPLLEEYFLGEYDEIVEVIPKEYIDLDTGEFLKKNSENIVQLINELADRNE